MSSQMTLLAEWEPFSGIWPQWGLLARGEVYEQPTWVPRTDGSALSFWPTAVAKDAADSGSAGYPTESGRHSGTTLTDAIRQWPTPNVPNGGRTTSVTNYAADGSKRQRDLRAVAAHWPEPDLWRTPAAGHAQKGASQPPEKRLAGGHELDLQDQAEFWQTPCVTDSHGHGWKTQGDCQALTLVGQARTFSPPDPPIPGGPPFWERVRILLRLCRQLKRQLPSPYRKNRSIFRPKLNPDFVDWLQGLPSGYTSEEFDSSAMETWLSRCRRRCASLCSPDGWGF
jgi:hypothetical protein